MTRPVKADRRGRERALRGAAASAGFTLVELVIVVAIVGILAAAVLPLAHWSVKRQREYELQQNLRIIRTAIDRYHDLALAGLIEVQPGDTGYPPDLEVLVEGIELTGEIPSPLPGVSDEFAATGGGLTGGLAGLAGRQQAGAGAGAFPAQGSGAGRGLGAGAPGAFPATGGGLAGGGPAGAQGRRAALAGAASSTMLQLEDLMAQRSGGLGGAQGQRGLGFPGSLADRGRGGRSGRAPGADVQKIVLLRRLPVDPITGEADWGLRCYGDPVEDRSWCGRNVFDVYSKAGGRAMDGRPYREW